MHRADHAGIETTDYVLNRDTLLAGLIGLMAGSLRVLWPWPNGVGVIVEAKHFCMMMRGVEKQNSLMKTSMMLGRFRTDHRTRTEFLNLVND